MLFTIYSLFGDTKNISEMFALPQRKGNMVDLLQINLPRKQKVKTIQNCIILNDAELKHPNGVCITAGEVQKRTKQLTTLTPHENEYNYAKFYYVEPNIIPEAIGQQVQHRGYDYRQLYFVRPERWLESFAEAKEVYEGNEDAKFAGITQAAKLVNAYAPVGNNGPAIEIYFLSHRRLQTPIAAPCLKITKQGSFLTWQGLAGFSKNSVIAMVPKK